MFLLTKSFGKPPSSWGSRRRRFHISQTMPCWQKAFQSRGSPKIHRKKNPRGVLYTVGCYKDGGRFKSCFRCCYDLEGWELPVAGMPRLGCPFSDMVTGWHPGAQATYIPQGYDTKQKSTSSPGPVFLSL